MLEFSTVKKLLCQRFKLQKSVEKFLKNPRRKQLDGKKVRWEIPTNFPPRWEISHRFKPLGNFLSISHRGGKLVEISHRIFFLK